MKNILLLTLCLVFVSPMFPMISEMHSANAQQVYTQEMINWPADEDNDRPPVERGLIQHYFETKYSAPRPKDKGFFDKIRSFFLIDYGDFKENHVHLMLGMSMISDDSSKYLTSKDTNTGNLHKFDLGSGFTYGLVYQRRVHPFLGAEVFFKASGASDSVSGSYNVNSFKFDTMSYGINVMGMYEIESLNLIPYGYLGLSSNKNKVSIGEKSEGTSLGAQMGVGADYYLGILGKSLKNVSVGVRLEYHINVQETRLWDGTVKDIDYSTTAFLFRVGYRF